MFFLNQTTNSHINQVAEVLNINMMDTRGDAIENLYVNYGILLCLFFNYFDNLLTDYKYTIVLLCS